VEQFGALSGPDVVQVGGMILAGLHHIHQRNIIHRDLHVDNILYSITNQYMFFLLYMYLTINSYVFFFYSYAPPRTASQKISIKISDFGISKLLRPTENAAVTFIGRDYDYCPELVTKGTVSIVNVFFETQFF
jgi:serine/threonine protein kinase